LRNLEEEIRNVDSKLV